MNYEVMLILKPLLPEDIKSNIIEDIEKLVKKYKGKITSTDVWGKRHLAYPIKKHDEGYYLIYKLDMEEENVKEFDRQLNLNSGVLRFLRIKQ
jgi:small subunit ribosomal protein S6